MTNVFNDSLKFMTASGQTDAPNKKLSKLYLSLIKEEYKELRDAVKAKDEVEILDALIDILVVTIGTAHAMGYDAEGAWNEVMKTNFAKIDPETGAVRRRAEDGKILKPEGWKEPELAPFLTRSK
jgi:predicted HAD superfamily Cof-like phosphohydrolase